VSLVSRAPLNDGNYATGNNVHDRTSFEFNYILRIKNMEAVESIEESNTEF
jgi:hypothetical protein